MIEKSINTLKGIGDKNSKLFSGLGISTIGDMLKFYPRIYSDRTVKRLCDVKDGDIACVCVTAAAQIKTIRTRTGMTVHKLYATDGTDFVTITWFNQDWLKRGFSYAKKYNVFGDIKFTMSGKEMFLRVMECADSPSVTDSIVPVYRLTKGLSHQMVVRTLKQCIPYANEIPEDMPPEIRESFGLCGIGYAVKNIHFPENPNAAEYARTRLAFDELFYLQLGLRLINRQKEVLSGIKFKDDRKIAAEFASSLPFKMTGAQIKTIEDIINDTKDGKLMNRLVQGDVGCGKTAVAAAAMLIAVKNGAQAAMMAPTEILARQHYDTLCGLLSQFGVKITLLTGSLKAKEKREALSQIQNGTADIVVGTHAVIQKDVTFKNLALAVTDEQHRFGVNQRGALTEKGSAVHILVMTATPIPRTLAIVLYGDLDVSVIDEMPPGRKPVKTYAVGEDMRERINKFMIKNINEGRQIYIICPSVDESETQNLKAVTAYAAEIQRSVFKNYKVEFVHGKLKPSEKDAVMQRFISGETNVLVSTTVIEVGVNVPNASVMVIENAERFGLSQLHQLRGRVGRGQWQSYCIMFCSGGEVATERMKVMTSTNSGFVIAEKDLELRGPGEFFGTNQHGLPELKVANIYEDMALVSKAQSAVNAVLSDDPYLENEKNSGIKAHVEKLYSSVINM